MQLHAYAPGFSDAIKTEIEITQKPLVIVIPSYNNKDWYDRNLGSVFSQKYKHYRIIYINDCSTDNTYDLVCNFVREQGQEHRTTIINNAVK